MKFHSQQKSTMPYIYGAHPIIEALRSGKEVEKILLKRGLRNDFSQEIIQLATENKIPIQEVPIEKLNAVTGKPHQGMIAFLSLIEYQDVENILPVVFEKGETPLFIILDKVTDVRNFGAICRSASCAGAHAIIIPSRGSAQINEDAIKSSAGAIHQIPICRSYNLKITIHFLKESGIKVIGVTEKTSDLIYSTDLKDPVALVLGNEEEGISPEYLKLCDAKIKIPMTGPIESLNVSVASAIALYEAVRQRTQN